MLAAALLGGATPAVAQSRPVRAYEQPLVIPAYGVGRPDPNPRFYTGRAYQGAQGRIYPYPLLDQLTDERTDRTFTALYVENEYLKVGVLPEIGGRVFEGLDKTNGYAFLYRQHVIKPALIGMLGAWISGGIEWNFPHHHRARAFMPVDYLLAENPDGSKTIWVNELDLRQRMKLTVGITLYPGKSYFEATIRPYNRTPLIQSFLYWANVAVHANESYQVIFPPGTEYAVFHGKNEFAHWPIAQETYRGIDYRGVDLSWWKNHPAPVSFFAWNYEDDFLAGYDHGRDAGIVYVADHRVAPGKKLWEWGPGPEGRLWDRILSDADGPYIELMAGAYTDNQPDYSWLQPYEAKEIRQYWYPIRGIGGVKNATLAAAVNLEVSEDGVARVGFHATAHYENARALLTAGDALILDERIDIDPGTPYVKAITLPQGTSETHLSTAGPQLRAALIASDGRELVAYQVQPRAGAPMPDVVTPPAAPQEIGTVEELYLTGLRLEQFHHPGLSPIPYYEEALRRDPGDSRANVALGIDELRRALFAQAAERFRAALARTTRNYTSPRDGEAYYYLGLALRMQGLLDAAYDALHRSTWSHAFHAAAHYQLAQIDCLRGDFETALEHLNRALSTNAWNTSAVDLKTAVLRRLGRHSAAAAEARRALERDPLDIWAAHELYLAQLAAGQRRAAAEARRWLEERRLGKYGLSEGSRPWHEAESWLEAQPFLEVAVDYGNAGLWQEAIGILSLLTDPGDAGEANVYPLLYYYLGHYQTKLGDEARAAASYRRAAELPPDYGFAFRLETIEVLSSAARANPADARAHYYLGNLLYESQPQRALEEWERSRELGGDFATLHRNLAIAYAQVGNDISAALASMEAAVERDSSDPRLLFERDLLYEAAGVAAEERLARLQSKQEIVVRHNDAFSREVVLLTQLRRYDEAIAFMETHHFRRWEGVENIYATYVDAHLLRGHARARAGLYADAIRDYEAALEYPANLDAAAPYGGGGECRVYYMIGAAYEAAGAAQRASEYYGKATTARRPAGRSALDYYQGAAYLKLGDQGRARELFEGLTSYARGWLESLAGGPSVDFFAKFGGRRPVSEQQADAYYLMGLGQLGLGRIAEARALFAEALSLNPNHLWAGAQLADSE
jgi:tetratricopeptide (TPR) repeat protein